MRKIVATENLTLDGVMEDPENWAFPYQSKDMGEFLQSGMDASDALLFGRVTFEKFAAFWPDSDIEPFASKLNNSPKYVVSTTLEKAVWGTTTETTTLIKGNVFDEISKLKQQDGKDITILGSGTLVESLLNEGLLDGLSLFVHPLVLGRGKRLFQNGINVNLKLVESRSFSSGVVMLTYEPVR